MQGEHARELGEVIGPRAHGPDIAVDEVLTGGEFDGGLLPVEDHDAGGAHGAETLSGGLGFAGGLDAGVGPALGELADRHHWIGLSRVERQTGAQGPGVFPPPG